MWIKLPRAQKNPTRKLEQSIPSDISGKLIHFSISFSWMLYVTMSKYVKLGVTCKHCYCLMMFKALLCALAWCLPIFMDLSRYFEGQGSRVNSRYERRGEFTNKMSCSCLGTHHSVPLGYSLVAGLRPWDAIMMQSYYFVLFFQYCSYRSLCPLVTKWKHQMFHVVPCQEMSLTLSRLRALGCRHCRELLTAWSHCPRLREALDEDMIANCRYLERYQLHILCVIESKPVLISKVFLKLLKPLVNF